VCSGYERQQRGGGRRCHGFTSDDGYAHCARIPCGEIEDGGTYAHRLSASCRCGTPHDSSGGTVVEDASGAPLAIDHIATWQGLERRSLVGERYLQGRGLDPHELRELGAVRYHPHYGSPSVALRDLSTGEICGIQSRRVDGGEPKNLTAKGSRCSGSAFIGRLTELDRRGPDVAVVVEGMTDALTAMLAFPGCVVFGAHSSAQLANVTAAVAPIIRGVSGWLLLVPHFDDDGISAGRAARRGAEAAGLVLDRDLHLVDLGAHNDLSDAWRAGWRWTWPTPRRAG
jgi:hypothetical protein